METPENILLPLSESDKYIIVSALAALAARPATALATRNYCVIMATRLSVIDEFKIIWEGFRSYDADVKETKSDNKAVWRTKEGKTVRLCDMDSGHLLNCIRLTERMAKGEEMIAQILALALMSFKPTLRLMEVIKAADKRPPPIMPDIYWDLRKEAEFRGIPVGKAKGRMANVEAGEVAPPAPLSRAFDFS